MQRYIERYQTTFTRNRLLKMPVVAILGPKQCGKSTLAKHLLKSIGDTLYLDLESNRDLRKLNDPETFFEDNTNKTICIDEINLIAAEHELWVIEDAAQSFEADYRDKKSSNLSTMATTSFFPAKQHGWVCKCGEKLDKSLNCSFCGKKYKESEGILESIINEDT